MAQTAIQFFTQKTLETKQNNLFFSLSASANKKNYVISDKRSKNAQRTREDVAQTIFEIFLAKITFNCGPIFVILKFSSFKKIERMQ